MSVMNDQKEEKAGPLGAILIAEDNADDAKLVQRAVLSLQLENPLHIVKDGVKTLAYLNGEPPFEDRKRFPFPALLLLDLRMPEIDGLEVLRRIKENPEFASMPVVVVTAVQDRKRLGEAYQLGANSFLSKPVDSKELENAIEGLGAAAQFPSRARTEKA
jgi:CheY-like chemotaxis protein